MHQAVLMGALRPTESRALSQDPDGKGRSSRSPFVWMQYVDPPPGTLRQTSYRTPPGLASHHRGAAQEARPPDDLVNRALEITRCESIETTLRTRRLLWAGTLLRMSGGRLPKRIMFGNLEGAVRRGRGGKEKEWTDCVQSDIRAFGTTGDCKAMALKAEVWVEAVTEGGRRFMAAWREEEEDAARHRQEKREATRLGKLQSHTEA